jgi:hypothetical protein
MTEGEDEMDESRGDSLTVEPFGFFTLDALRAGWYLMWRQLVRVVPVAIGATIVAAGLAKLGLTVFAILVASLGVIAASIWAIVLVPKLASQWAVERYGYPLTGAGRVWWGIVWRVFVASLVAGVILTPPSFVATSLTASFPASALGQLGKLLTLLLGLANIAVSLLATGWAMSRVAAVQLTGLPVSRVHAEPHFPVVERPSLDTAPAFADAFAGAEPVTAASSATLPPALAVAPAPPAVRAPAGAEGKRQCPKCGLHETERGKVIGWYCTICGWRESRR